MDPDELAARLELPTLRLVRAIAEHGTLTAAAASLGYSQPALSGRLRDFERRTGLALVERAGRGLRLTEAGRILARHAGAVLTGIDAAAGELAELAGLRTGTVRLVAFPSASATLVPAVLGALARRYPDLTVVYVEAEPPEAVAAVREDRADIALTFSYPGDLGDPHRRSARGLDVRDFGDEPVHLVLPAAHPAAGAPETDLADLAGEDWIAGCPRCRGHLLELCDRAGFAPRIVRETDNFVAVEGMVAAGLGVALLPGLALSATGRRDGVVARPTSAGDSRALHLVTAMGAERVPAVSAVIDALRAARRAPSNAPVE